MNAPSGGVVDAPATTADPREDAAEAMTEILAGLLERETVARDDHFFEVLGANSMTMAHFCAKVRKHDGLPSVSIKQVYAAPTIASLVLSVLPLATTEPGSAVVPPSVEVVEPEPARATSTRVLVCGTVQALVFVAYSWVLMQIVVPGYSWIADARGVGEIYVRSVLVGGGIFLGACLLPVAVKWLLVGRWTAREIPLWSVAYLRFWTVKSLLHANPMILFVGSPLYTAYLRLLGARVGPGVTVLSRSVPVCTDLLTLGAGAVVRKDCFFLGYRAHAGTIQTGPVTIGAGALVGEKTVLDIDTRVGVGSQLGHTSSLHRGEQVPDGERWHGSPVERTDLDYVRVEPRPTSRWRRASYTFGSLAQLFLLVLPLLFGGSYLLVAEVPALGVLAFPTLDASGSVYLRALALAAVLFVALGVLMALLVFVVPRAMGALIKPGVAYPLHGLHYSMHRSITMLTNRRLLTWLFGDSSFVTGYLSKVGYDLGTVEQTGSNFGTEVQHETPYQVSVGGGTMVADGLSILNADYSSTSFRVSRVEIGGRSFLGNNLAYPSGARIRENCLIATKAMVPLEGPVRQGVGLLGSPPFEIPRTVDRDATFDHLRSGESLASALHDKDRYNLRSMVLMSSLRFVHLFLLSLLGLVALEGLAGGALGATLIAVYAPLSLVLTAGFWILVERVLCRFRPLQPQLRSIYDPHFWRHERLWKVPDVYLNAFNGTPFKSVVWRLLGVRIGARVFDDGAYLTERTLTTIGDDATLNVGSKLQCHSQEDGTFKSDRTSVGAGATLGVAAFVHYGVTIGEGSVVMADSFLMKGEQVPAQRRWGGNPAVAVHEPATATGTATPAATAAATSSEVRR